MEFDFVLTLGSPSFEHAEIHTSECANRFVADRVGLDVCAGVVFLFHVYSIPQNPQKARDFFAIVESFFVDEKKVLELARCLNSILHKLLIFNDLRRAAGRARVSA